LKTSSLINLLRKIKKTKKTTNNEGGISMPIGFVRSEEIEETWIEKLVKHILFCKDVNCFRCAEAVEYQYWTYID